MASLILILHLWLDLLLVLTSELWAVGQPSHPFRQNDCPTSSSGKRSVPRMPISNRLRFYQRRNCIKASIRDLAGHSWAVQGAAFHGWRNTGYFLPLSPRREGWHLCVRLCSTGHTRVHPVPPRCLLYLPHVFCTAVCLAASASITPSSRHLFPALGRPLGGLSSAHFSVWVLGPSPPYTVLSGLSTATSLRPTLLSVTLEFSVSPPWRLDSGNK